MTPCCCLFPRFFGVKSGVNGFVAVPTCPASGKAFICLGLAPDATLDGVGGPNKDCCSDLSKPRLDKSSTLPSLCPVCSVISKNCDVLASIWRKKPVQRFLVKSCMAA